MQLEGLAGGEKAIVVANELQGDAQLELSNKAGLVILLCGETSFEVLRLGLL